MLKRLLDIVFSVVGLVFAAPVILPAMFLIWIQDLHSPLYIANRVGLNGSLFRMVKLRSMLVNADKAGIDSTSTKDPRITSVGQFIRNWKLDEISQLWNVLTGQMSLVGPRPNVQSETSRYTEVEKGLLTVKPGITDISSIVFSDEGEILKDSADPDLDYNRLIRPWKSRLGLLYIEHRSTRLDLALVAITVLAILSKPTALRLLDKIMVRIGSPDELRRIAMRQSALIPSAPPGASAPVTAADMYGQKALV